MIYNAPYAVIETFLKMKSERGKKIELKVIGRNYNRYLHRSYGTRRERSL